MMLSMLAIHAFLFLSGSCLALEDTSKLPKDGSNSTGVNDLLYHRPLSFSVPRSVAECHFKEAASCHEDLLSDMMVQVHDIWTNISSSIELAATQVKFNHRPQVDNDQIVVEDNLIKILVKLREDELKFARKTHNWNLCAQWDFNNTKASILETCSKLLLTVRCSFEAKMRWAFDLTFHTIHLAGHNWTEPLACSLAEHLRILIDFKSVRFVQRASNATGLIDEAIKLLDVNLNQQIACLMAEVTSNANNKFVESVAKQDFIEARPIMWNWRITDKDKFRLLDTNMFLAYYRLASNINYYLLMDDSIPFESFIVEALHECSSIHSALKSVFVAMQLQEHLYGYRIGRFANLTREIPCLNRELENSSLLKKIHEQERKFIRFWANEILDTNSLNSLFIAGWHDIKCRPGITLYIEPILVSAYSGNETLIPRILDFIEGVHCVKQELIWLKSLIEQAHISGHLRGLNVIRMANLLRYDFHPLWSSQSANTSERDLLYKLKNLLPNPAVNFIWADYCKLKSRSVSEYLYPDLELKHTRKKRRVFSLRNGSEPEGQLGHWIFAAHQRGRYFSIMSAQFDEFLHGDDCNEKSEDLTHVSTLIDRDQPSGLGLWQIALVQNGTCDDYFTLKNKNSNQYLVVGDFKWSLTSMAIFFLNGLSLRDNDSLYGRDSREVYTWTRQAGSQPEGRQAHFQLECFTSSKHINGPTSI